MTTPGMTTDGPSEEVSIQVTHSIEVRNSAPEAPFHEMASSTSSDIVETLLGGSSHVTWQPPAPVVRTNQGIICSSP